MDRVKLCDVCLGEGKLSLCKWTTKWSGFGLRIHLCAEHKDFAKGMKKETVMDQLLKAEQSYNRIILEK